MARFGYGRVSRPDQTPENQRQELVSAGQQIDYWYADVGVSGKVPAASRPQFGLLLDRIRDGEVLVVSKLDRLGRDIADILATVRALQERSIQVVVLQMGGVDLTSTAGKLILAVLAAVAEMERDLIVERTLAGHARARAEGKRVGRPAVVTPEQRAEIRVRLDAGATPTEIKREYGVSRAWVYLERAQMERERAA